VNGQRFDLVFEITWAGGWHVGSGHAGARVDRLVRRRGGLHGPPFVPGAQLKGVLRHQCERLAAVLGCRVVSPHAGEAAQRDTLVEAFQPLARSEFPVDRLFGSRYQGECLFVEDALPSRSPGGTRSLPAARTAIDRVTGTSREQHLFVTEVAGQPARGLRGRLRARHPAGVLTQFGDDLPYEYGLLLAAFRGLEALGGNKSVGLGECRVALVGDPAPRWNSNALSADELDRRVENCFDEADWADWVAEVRKEQE
jgi:CRISPR/Cas system CSM-associated protein Csm3 (group 7 of RAMP superfamily)